MVDRVSGNCESDDFGSGHEAFVITYKLITYVDEIFKLQE